MKHPNQRVFVDDFGTKRFTSNEIIKGLFKPEDLAKLLASRHHDPEDVKQVIQQMGTSVESFEEMTAGLSGGTSKTVSNGGGSVAIQPRGELTTSTFAPFGGRRVIDALNENGGSPLIIPAAIFVRTKGKFPGEKFCRYTIIPVKVECHAENCSIDDYPMDQARSVACDAVAKWMQDNGLRDWNMFGNWLEADAESRSVFQLLPWENSLVAEMN